MSYGDSKNNENNSCFDTHDYKAVKGLQNISPCQYGSYILDQFSFFEQAHEINILGAPVYLSNPHFFQADPSLIAEVEGLKPNRTLHQTYFKIQPVPLSSCVLNNFFAYRNINQSIGVPVEGKVRIQLNLKVEQAKHINSVKNFRDIIFPIVWVEEVSVAQTAALKDKNDSIMAFIISTTAAII